MRRIVLYILSILFVANFFNFAQSNLELQKNYADSLFNSENYFDAITEYKRLDFFDSEKKYSFELNYKIGVSYKQGGWYDDAIKYFSIASKIITESENKNDCSMQIVRCNILRHTPERAIELLTKLEKNSTNKNKLEEINYWKGWAYIFADSFDVASEYFSSVENGDELKKLCNDVVNQKYSVNFAKTISYVLPGSGLIYTGNYLQGFLSLGWNVLWGYLTINSFLQDRAFDGILVGELLWLRFYTGGSQGAEHKAIEKNKSITNEALIYLQNNYKGRKP